MSSRRRNDRLPPRTELELYGKELRRRKQQSDGADPYDSSRSFAGVRPPLELFRRQRREHCDTKPREREKRIKFEIVDDTRPHSKAGGYNPYDVSRR